MLQLAQAADRDAVNCLAQDVHEMHVSWRPDIYREAAELFPETRFHALTRSRSLYVAKIDDTVVGYTVISIRTSEGIGIMPRKIMLIEEFCVAQCCRNHGIGFQMMTDLRALAKAFGCTDLQLSVYPQNDEAVGFYQKCGFTIKTIQMQTKV